MRISIQGCLILLLCFFIFSGDLYAASGQFGSTSCGAAYGSWKPPSYSQSNADAHDAVKPDGIADCAAKMPALLDACIAEKGSCFAKVTVDQYAVFDGANYVSRYREYPYWTDLQCASPNIIDQNGDCVPPPCEEPDFIDPETGECRSPQELEECRETGDLFDPKTSSCVAECPSGALNGICLETPEPDPDTCDANSDDYRGTVNQGFGNPPLAICGDTTCTTGGKPGQSGIFNGELVCLAEDYGAPKCQGGTITVIDEYGFICAGIDEPEDEEPETPEEPNTDTDDDGVPDEYQPDNDPNINRKQLDELKKGQDKANKSLENLENLSGKGNKILEGIKKDTGKANDLLDGIEKNTDDSVGLLRQISDAMKAPEGGYNTDGLGDAPTFSESSDRLQLAITSNPTIQAVTTVPSIASNNTCPVWTIPATDYWQAMPIDSHCQILDDHRSLLSMLFIAVWTLAAVFVFLRA